MDLNVVIPGILTADFSLWRDKLQVLGERGGWAHIDVMDNTMVSQRTVTLKEGSKVAKDIKMPLLEVHLMVEKPEEYRNDCKELGVRRVILHQESYKDAPELAKACLSWREIEIEPCITAFPDRALWNVPGISEYQIMGVEPGKAGQNMLPETEQRVEAFKQDEARSGMIISVDGGVNLENGVRLRRVGADRLIVNTAFWGCDSPQELISALTKGG